MKSDDTQNCLKGLKKNVQKRNNNNEELPSESEQGLPFETEDPKYLFMIWNEISFIGKIRIVA